MKAFPRAAGLRRLGAALARCEKGGAIAADSTPRAVRDAAPRGTLAGPAEQSPDVPLSRTPPTRTSRKASTPNAGARRAKLFLRPLRWLQDQLKRPLRLERRGFHLHLVLEASRHSRSAAADESLAEDPVRQARRELKGLLNQHESTRALMRHLDYVESRMRRGVAVSALPASVRSKALAQLETLAGTAPAGPLALLHQWLGVGLAHDRQPYDEADNRRSEFHAPGKVQVSEGSDTDFQEANRIWAANMPLASANPQPPAAEPDSEPGVLKLVPIEPAEPAPPSEPTRK